MSNYGYVAQFVLAALYLKFKNYHEADKTIQAIVKNWGRIAFPDHYLNIVEKVLIPYCSSKPELKCTEFFSRFAVKETQFFYE
jgi:hypothetical protein